MYIPTKLSRHSVYSKNMKTQLEKWAVVIDNGKEKVKSFIIVNYVSLYWYNTNNIGRYLHWKIIRGK